MSSEDEIAPERFAKLEERLARAERSLCRLRRRQRTCNALALFAVLFVLFANKTTLAVRYGAVLNALTGRVAAVENKTASISTLTDPNTGQPTVRFSRVNIQIVNGTGETERATGAGNLIIGYNELREDNEDVRTGSHNLIVGKANDYSNCAGAVIGDENGIYGAFAAAVGGTRNKVKAKHSAVLGGEINVVCAASAVLVGGRANTVSGLYGTTIGGFGNSSAGTYSHITGGKLNNVYAEDVTLVGKRKHCH